ncbi:hypothetical protein ES288_A12G153600v1 [Gossypium darwinii]|uniref:Uncharacterized protein n=1 Tax=Gossypium darwinii TaxID=34276 RepID=A0A5D2E9Z9_GOSDA|nr:hypothetical protein ES288_A12G153600v1 [Gossypium darwinii]
MHFWLKTHPKTPLSTPADQRVPPLPKESVEFYQCPYLKRYPTILHNINSVTCAHSPIEIHF